MLTSPDAGRKSNSFNLISMRVRWPAWFSTLKKKTFPPPRLVGGVLIDGKYYFALVIESDGGSDVMQFAAGAHYVNTDFNFAFVLTLSSHSSAHPPALLVLSKHQLESDGNQKKWNKSNTWKWPPAIYLRRPQSVRNIQISRIRQFACESQVTHLDDPRPPSGHQANFSKLCFHLFPSKSLNSTNNLDKVWKTSAGVVRLKSFDWKKGSEGCIFCCCCCVPFTSSSCSEVGGRQCWNTF